MKQRAGFTLTELLIVIGILLLLSTLSLAVYNTGKSSDRLRSAARIGQSAFLGAKDRAMHAKDFRGIRLTRDQNGPTFSATNAYPALVNGFIYIQPLALQSLGNLNAQAAQNNVAVMRPALSNDATVVVISGAQGAALLSQDVNMIWPRSTMQVRIPSGQSAAPGQWYTLNPNANAAGGAFWVSTDANGNQNLLLQVPLNAGAPAPAQYAFNFIDPNSSIDIQLGNEVLPFHQPIALPSASVIDLRYSSSNVQFLAGGNILNTGNSLPPNIDISFSPRGSVAGATGGLGALYFCLRDLEDAMGPSSVFAPVPPATYVPRDPSDAACKGDCLILALNPATGLVQTYPADLTDIYINSNGANTGDPTKPGSDGYVDNLFSFAQQGKAAGR
jgi:prepilin-type N-terminal cleavage/methylation domain-containing protein